ncbi:phage replisome organizer N-terminal domain-containing protein [Clostridium sporogenes]|uniref:phage replisome organizer N-terminal domain-containing protein n=1 Tax=Clostridium sporogenes TaxID=1509 RepID=UPI001F1878B0|nr:phage replisome organizer N-terminal domain-containing protein [Clostridium sporogenes]EKS4344814.1 phage replisome organizer N-terminal domain-containing protein [Clostridium botulinum]EKS4395287.1 phage replisome organizer N-terminal domain-containing protein [Clostridium botulinum]UJA30891.1 phage replisome organizer N-terminal domain-containing protein [Clostridium sporogenes]
MSKKYYWLKLQDNFFDREEIKIVENMPNGKEYIIFYMKLLLKSIKTEGKLKFREIIPYTPEMLSHVTGTNIDTVINAIDLFSRLQLMEKWDDGTLFMAETKNMIGSESKWAEIKRKQRNTKKELKPPLDNVPPLSAECPTEIDIEKEIDKDIELDKDIDKDNIRINWKDILTAWNNLPKPIKPIRSVTKQRKDKIKARINSLKLKEEDVLKAIGNIRNSRFCQGQNDRNWIIEFDWLFQDDTRFTKVFENKYADKEGKNGYTENNTGNKEQYDFSNY